MTEKETFGSAWKEFKEGISGTAKEHKEGRKEDKRKNKEEYQTKLAEAQVKHDAKIKKYNQNNASTSESEKLAKTGNFAVRGLAFWLLIPFFMVLAIILVFVGFGIWDWIV